MSEFKRENRYLVLKRSDLSKYLSRQEIETLEQIGNRVADFRQLDGKDPLQCVVIERDWPEFEPTWKAIENRMSGIVDQPTLCLIKHLYRQIAFSLKAFGPGARTEGVVDHICKELKEVLAAPHDLEEWTDLILLSLDGAWRAGYTPEEVADSVTAKLAKNEARTWPDWRTADPTKAIEHIRS